LELETGAQSDPLAVALLPVLLHKLNNATQVLSSMNSLLTIAGGEELFCDQTRQLGATSARVDELGWLLAVLASASGTDMLLERREPRGLSIMASLVSEALRRRGQVMDKVADLPELAPNPCAGVGGWELPWALGTLLVHSAADLADGASLRWSHENTGGAWCLRGPQGASVLGVGGAVRSRLPGAEFASGADGWSLSVPVAWIVASG